MPELRALDIEDLPWELVGRGRNVSIRRKVLPVTVPRGTVELSYMVVPAGYEVPVHQHNCDQVRYVIEGSLNIAPGSAMEAGDCGYFPQGVPYGPQSQPADCLCLLMQMDAASGAGLIPNAAMEAMHKTLVEEGAVFAGGLLVATAAGPVLPPVDAYQAIWERHQGRPMHHAPPRYAAPILIRSTHFLWVREAEGCARKRLGTFGESRLTCEMVKLRPGGVLPPPAGRVGEAFLLLAGEVDTGSRVVRAPAYLFVPASPQRLQVVATQAGCTLFGIGLPEHFDENFASYPCADDLEGVGATARHPRGGW